MDVHLLSLSAHKFYGPKGSAVLHVPKRVRMDPLLHNGHHQRNGRARTENLAGIIGLGKAVEMAQQLRNMSPSGARGGHKMKRTYG